MQRFRTNFRMPQSKGSLLVPPQRCIPGILRRSPLPSRGGRGAVSRWLESGIRVFRSTVFDRVIHCGVAAAFRLYRQVPSTRTEGVAVAAYCHGDTSGAPDQIRALAP